MRSKTATLNLRIDPALKDALREASAREHRSAANMVETLIRRHCREQWIATPALAQRPRESADE